VAYELVHEAAWPGQAIGRTILGTPDNVRRFSAGDLRRFLGAHYKPANMVLAAAGAVNHEAFLRHAEALFGGLSKGGVGAEQGARYEGGTRWHPKRFEQSHLMLAFEGPSYRDHEFFAAQVFSGLFGGGMSSRLFQEVREKRGLCYAIYSSAWGLKDTGMFAVHAATGTEMMAELIEVVGIELERMGDKGPAAAEVARSKAQLKAGLLMSLESSTARAEQMARQLLSFGRLLPADELVQKVDAVTEERVRDLARGLAAIRPAVAVVGAGKRSAKLALLAEERMTTKSAGSAAWHS
jgi:predicted Zn-dependent peptidase